jgi:hypothetical protein
MKKVKTADGRHWTVRRKWAPHRWDPRIPGGPAFSRSPSDPAALEILFYIPVVGLILAAIFFFFLFLFAVQFAILLMLIPITLVARVIFRRPWVVQAWTDEHPPEVRYWHVIGWNRSGEVVREVARSLEDGSDFESVHATPVTVPNRVAARS